MHMETKHENFTPDPTDYNAPMYKTGAHAGVLSTTGDLSFCIIECIYFIQFYQT